MGTVLVLFALFAATFLIAVVYFDYQNMKQRIQNIERRQSDFEFDVKSGRYRNRGRGDL